MGYILSGKNVLRYFNTAGFFLTMFEFRGLTKPL